MISVAAIVVTSLLATGMACTLFGLVLKVRKGRRKNAKKSTPRDLEKALPPLRRVQIRRGKVVSWASTNKSIARGITRHSTPKTICSRRSSILSLPMTIDLEREIESFRRDYALAKEKEALDPGCAADINGLYPIIELEPPAAVARPNILGSIYESEDPADMIKESSWETYNGHRPSDHALSSYIGSLSPSLEKALQDIVPASSPSPLSKPSTESPALGALTEEKSSRHGSFEHAKVDEMQKRISKDTAAGPRHSRSTALLPLHIKVPSQSSSLAGPRSPKSEVASPTSPAYAPSIQSAIYKSPIQDIIPAAPQPRKPSQLDLRGSFSRLEITIPSPVTVASTVTSPASPRTVSIYSNRATLGRLTPHGNRYSTVSSKAESMDCLEVELSVRHSRTRRARPTSTSSRSTSRSRRSRSHSISHRVHKRPPPLAITEPVPRVPTTGWKVALSDQDQGLYTSVFPSSPTVSDSGTPDTPRAADVLPVEASLKSFATSNQSPVFAVTPAYRVPLYGGRDVVAPKPQTLAKKDEAPATIDLDRRGSDGDVVQKPKRAIREQERPSVLRTYSHAPALEKTTWPPSDLQSMLVQAHGMAQSTTPITPATSSFNTPRGSTYHTAAAASSTTQVRPPLMSSRSLTATLLPTIARTSGNAKAADTKASKSKRTGKSLFHSLSSSLLRDDAKSSPKSAKEPLPSGKRDFPEHATTKRSPKIEQKALPPLPPNTAPLPSVPSSTTPPGVQRVEVPALRIEHPDGSSAVRGSAAHGAATHAGRNVQSLPLEFSHTLPQSISVALRGPSSQPASQRPSLERQVPGRPGLLRRATEQPSLERQVQGRPSLERRATEHPGLERQVQSRPGLERRATEQPSLERQVQRRPSLERPGLERRATERPGVERQDPSAAKKLAVRPTAKRSVSAAATLQLDSFSSASPPRFPEKRRRSGLDMIAVAAARKERVPVVTHKELPGSGSDDDLSPGISAASTPVGKPIARTIGRGASREAAKVNRHARRWETLSAVSPLSGDFPAFVKA